MNVIHLMGNVGRDPEMRYTSSGSVVANFSVATSRKYKGEEETTWHNCVAFGKQAEVIQQYVTKGTKLVVTGRLTKRRYTDKNGNEKEAVDVVVNEFHFAGGKTESRQHSNPVTGEPEGRREPDDDIPF